MTWMNTPPAPLLLPLLFHAALASVLPAPCDLYMDSVNFRHILRWRPGNGTPPGTRYIISKDKERGKRQKWLANSTTTWVQLHLRNPQNFYYLNVAASYNQSVSPVATLRFTPYEQTKIGAPAVSVVGCGDCLHVNVSLLVDDSSFKEDIYTMFDPSFRVVYKKSGGKEITYNTVNRNFTLSNLHRGTEYCLQVHTLIRINQNTEPSNWTCAFTSSQEPSRASAIVATVTVVGVVVLGGLMAATLCLYFTGFLCKLRASVPRALRAALNRGYTLTPEKIIPNVVSVSLHRGKQRRHNSLTVPQAATGGAEEEEEVEEEEDEQTIYLNKATKSVSGDSAHEYFDKESVSRTLAVAECSSCSIEEPKNEVTEEEVPFPTEETPTEVRVCVTEEEVQEKEEKDCSGDVDLFSVTLAALAVCEREEEDTGDMGDEASNEVTSLHADIESHDETAEDPGRAWTQCGDTDEEDEEDEEFSGYMRHT